MMEESVLPTFDEWCNANVYGAWDDGCYWSHHLDVSVYRRLSEDVYSILAANPEHRVGYRVLYKDSRTADEFLREALIKLGKVKP